MSNLYNMTQEYYAALEALTDPELDIDQQTVSDTLESLDWDYETKLLNVAKYIKSLELERSNVHQVQSDLLKRMKSLDSKAESMRNYLLDSMRTTGKDKVSDPAIIVALRKTPESVHVLDETVIPKRFWKVKEIETIDKTAIKEAGGCAGVEIKSGLTVSIK